MANALTAGNLPAGGEKRSILYPLAAPAAGRRGLKIGMAGLLLFLGMPFLLLIALLVIIDSPGPALFIQRRLGLNGREFSCFKFRTMYREAAGILEVYLQDDPDRGEEWHDYAKLKGDPRITRAGRLLRRFSLDELPQLINVLKGDMSFIGPRPYLITERERLGEYAAAILSVRPGLTGLWQVSGRNQLDFAARLELDARYASRHSLSLDLFILLRTLPAVLSGRGAY